MYRSRGRDPSGRPGPLWRTRIVAGTPSRTVEGTTSKSKGARGRVGPGDPRRSAPATRAESSSASATQPARRRGSGCPWGSRRRCPRRLEPRTRPTATAAAARLTARPMRTEAGRYSKATSCAPGPSRTARNA
ncbi:MAG TPA: hypothetical protein DCQ64_24715 [Candidatus Rokubacteria bacterium]|nr:hypothetical protein [Candidatus Rokubacteria bacterium]